MGATHQCIVGQYQGIYKQDNLNTLRVGEKIIYYIIVSEKLKFNKRHKSKKKFKKLRQKNKYAEDMITNNIIWVILKIYKAKKINCAQI